MVEQFKPEKFLRRKFWTYEDFRNAVKKASKRKLKKIPPEPEKQIEAYLDRILEILKKERGKELLRREILYKIFIIKPENIPQDYFKNVLLGNFAERLGYNRQQLRNPDIKQMVIKQFKQETGQSFEEYQVPEEEKNTLIQQIIEDQKRSLDYWFDYLTSPEAENYPPAFRYWVFAEVLKCGNYDEERKEYNERTKSTVAPFPELNQQALGLLIDELIRKERKEPSQLINLPEEQQKEWLKLLQTENFRKLYPWLLEYVKSLKLPEERLVITEGKWKVFSQNSNPKELVQAIQGFNTGWCIAAEATAQSYLSQSDIYIYFSKDKEGKYTIPRVAIVFNKSLNKITEIRGIEQNQHLDQYIAPIVEQALTQGLKIEEKEIKLPGSERYLQATKDMKQLAEIYIKYLQNQEFTNEELRFLYEIDRKIQGFGYQRDPRIEEILAKRNIRKDLATIFQCREDQIALKDTDITDETVALWGNLTQEVSSQWEKFPKNLIFIQGDANFRNSQVKNLGKLKRIGRNANFEGSQITTLGELEEIGGDANFRNSQVKDLGNLKRIGGYADFEGSQITTLGNLEEIEGNAYFKNSRVEDLGNLRRIGGYADFKRSKITTLGELKEIGGSVNFRNSEIKNLGNLERIGGICIVNRNNEILIKLLKSKGFTNIVDEFGNPIS